MAYTVVHEVGHALGCVPASFDPSGHCNNALCIMYVRKNGATVIAPSLLGDECRQYVRIHNVQ
jgi:hypothetical protein